MAKRTRDPDDSRTVPAVREQIEQLPAELKELAVRTRPDLEVPQSIRARATGELDAASDSEGSAELTLESAPPGAFFGDEEFTEAPTLEMEEDPRLLWAAERRHRSEGRTLEAREGPDPVGTEETEVISYITDASIPELKDTDLIPLARPPASVGDEDFAAFTNRRPIPRALPDAAENLETSPGGHETEPAAAVSQDTDPWIREGISFGRYRLLRHLSSGGMGTVFQAVTRLDSGAERLVAIKRLPAPSSDQDRFVRMLLDEARIMIRLRHPAIVKVYEFGKVGLEHFLAMEYVHGRDLDSLMRALRRRKTRFPVGIAIYVIGRVLEALEHAHQARDDNGGAAGIVHRDVSPPNILCGFTGKVKLTDFGVAKAARRFAVTKPGEVRGKLAYMSPEQLTDEEVDQRSDLFAVGIVLHELLSGASLFRGQVAAETMYKVLEAPIPPLARSRPDIPVELAMITQTALRRDPEQRFSCAREMREALSRVVLERAGENPAEELAALLVELFKGEPAGLPLQR